MSVITRFAVIAVGALTTLVPTAAIADSANNEAPDTVVFGGGEYFQTGSNRSGGGVGAGFLHALSGDLSTGGWAVSAYLGYANTTTAGTPSTSGYGWAVVSHVWPMPTGYFTLGAGVNVESDKSPGAILQYGFEHASENAAYFQSYGSITAVDNSSYLHAKAGYKTPDSRFGGELTFWDDDTSSPTWRYGVFLGDIDVGSDASMVVSAGYQNDTTPGISDGFYTTIGFSFPLSIR